MRRGLWIHSYLTLGIVLAAVLGIYIALVWPYARDAFRERGHHR